VSPNRRAYWDFPEHRSWQYHYAEGNYGGRYLLFCREFREKVLPEEMRKLSSTSGHVYELALVIRDKQTDKLYTCSHCMAYEHDGSRLSVQDQDWNSVDADSLMPYFYGCHFCDCHIAHHIESAGQLITGYHDVELTDDTRCNRRRFSIVKAVWNQMPELVLLSETMTDEELEVQLETLRQPYQYTWR
jgi:hypothetical protein